MDRITAEPTTTASAQNLRFAEERIADLAAGLVDQRCE
jgi:hypothetical protein